MIPLSYCEVCPLPTRCERCQGIWDRLIHRERCQRLDCPSPCEGEYAFCDLHRIEWGTFVTRWAELAARDEAWRLLHRKR